MKKRTFLGIILPLFLLTLSPINQNLTLQNNNKFESSTNLTLENVISRRMSVRNYDLDTAVSSELVLKVLWAAYGYSWRGRTVTSFSGYPIIIYVSNETATYRFIPETQSLSLWKEGDHRELGRVYDAPTQLYLILDTNICSSTYWGNAEVGSIIQNIYLMANVLNLGTVCMYPNRTDIDQGLGLPPNEETLYKMPLGYPSSPYADYQNLTPTLHPSSPKLPEIQDSTIILENALHSVHPSHEWSENPVTQQELSQLLWASYGYSYYEDTAENPPERHRTVPSAHAYYPLKVYAANSSGVYEYLPEQHTLTTITTEDRRSSIAQASGTPWASAAPLILTVAYVENQSVQYYIGGQETYVEIGLLAQNVFLESVAWGLAAEWSKASSNQQGMREALGLAEETELHPVSIITIGHPSTYLHKAEWEERNYTIQTTTNSTISNFVFDQSERKISFDVSGSSDTTGFCNVITPFTLLWGDFTVLINGNPPPTLTQGSNATHNSLYFTYDLLSTLNVQIISEYVIPEFQTEKAMLFILLIAGFTLLVYKRKINSDQKKCE